MEHIPSQSDDDDLPEIQESYAGRIPSLGKGGGSGIEEDGALFPLHRGHVGMPRDEKIRSAAKRQFPHLGKIFSVREEESRGQRIIF